MEQFAFKDLTIWKSSKPFCIEDEFRDWPDVGIAIQAYLRSTLDDLQILADWSANAARPSGSASSRERIGISKPSSPPRTAGPSPSSPKKPQTDANFEAAASIPHRKSPPSSPRHRQPQRPQHRRRDRRCRAIRSEKPAKSNSRCSSAWPTPQIRPRRNELSRPRLLPRRRTFCPAWPISSADFSKIPPTNPSCGPASSITRPRSNCS